MTAHDVFSRALALMDEYDEDGPIADETIAARVPSLLDVGQRRVALYDGTTVTQTITSLDDELEITDDAAHQILVYWLAMQMALADKNADMYNTLETAYMTGISTMKFDETDIGDEYNVLAGL